ncbi:MAG: vWA domain-containing protein [Bacillota bacterium]
MNQLEQVPCQLKLVGEYIWAVVSRGQGVRLGEAAVVSMRVHTIEPPTASHVKVLTGSDAGQVFYGRRLKDQVVHVDVFHEIGQVDHRKVAASIATTFNRFKDPQLSQLLDYTDLQTGTGGGRVTGSLTFGTRPSLRRAHSNHVHVAVKMDPARVWSLVLLVAAVEDAICGQGLQLRMVERITNVLGSQGEGALDLSDYASDSDSLLREANASQFADMQLAVELADELGGVEEARSALEQLERSERGCLPQWLPGKGSDLQEVCEELVRKGVAARDKWGWQLTEKGKRVMEVFKYRRREIEALFRRMLRRLPEIRCVPTKGRKRWRNVKPGELWRRSLAVAPEKGEWIGEIAVPETMIRALASSATRGSLQIGGQSIMVHRRVQGSDSSVLLLVDASASMAGKRIRAAKHLARHLLLSTKGKIGIAVFQENGVKLMVRFTRNYRRLDDGIRAIQPSGLTPMAEGICHAVAQLKRIRCGQPLLLMITDGIPTVPKWTLNPVEDALNAASAIQSNRIRFACVGLEPNKGFLEEMTSRANGNLYVVGEIEKHVLVGIAQSEVTNH